MAGDDARPKPLAEQAGPGPFAEAAHRLDAMAETIKARQAAEQQAKNGAAPVVPPEQRWASQFANQAIGPAGAEPSSVHAPVRHARTIAPDLSALKASAVPLPERVSQRMDVRLDLKPGAMAERLARKEKPRRSLLARLFGRD
ncbi:MAG: hypothetical protein KGR48_11790 [Alphaproteobacteria bacterium]|nr:hypothetical protein [Alphaproteobacteria bacterium]MDE2013421.1 hypothetical protein [Alphaproteobacteria bacterium]MDE2073272.1 hypothetical protein [Alphaproteobacteria bacterium]MDE2351220.1 hypothetical protein [Alphaproteobacteria bacterium]